MRIFIAFEGVCEPFDIQPQQTVGAVKRAIKDRFHIQLSDDKQGRRYLELIYAGALLKDEWVLADIGITLCSTIKCVVKEEDKPILYVFNAATGLTIPIMGSIYLLTTTVSDLKTLVTRKCGFPVSVYCLRTPQGTEMYDCNTLTDYKLDIGATLRMDVWDTWVEFLNGSRLGHKHTVEQYLLKEEPVMRYQLRVALYIAAFFGHLDLAECMLQLGARADESVGGHPYREWCSETDHPALTKCPVHAAAEAGQLLILKAFVTYNAACLEREDAQGKSPLKICIEQRHKDCVRYLIMKIWSVVSFPKLSIPMKIYVKLKKWLDRAQKGILARKCPHQASGFRTRVGDMVVVDGFTEPKMTSKGFFTAKKKRISSDWASVDDGIFQGKECVAQTRKKSWQSLKLPAVRHSKKKTSSLQKTEVKIGATSEGERNMWTGRVPLPAIASSLHPPFYYTEPRAAQLINTSLESFLEHSGRTSRENAIYCLALASEFKEKPWLHQLGMARILARKTVCNPLF
ncbi:protein ANKUB1 [Lissotriton helveticus]